MNLELQGKVALVTGAGQGVGREIAKVLAAEGAKLVVNDYFIDRAEAVAREIKEAGREAFGIQSDVTDRHKIEDMVGKIKEQYGLVDILVNNAGVPVTIRAGQEKRTTFAALDPEMWKKDIDLSFYGCLNCIGAVLQSMIDRKQGKIVNIISEAGRIGEANLSIYSGAKGGVLAFSKALAKEVGKDCINVNCVALGAVAHEGLKGFLSSSATPETDPILQKLLKFYPIGRGLGRVGRPSDVASVVAFLASPKADFITGQCLGINGGFSMA